MRLRDRWVVWLTASLSVALLSSVGLTWAVPPTGGEDDPPEKKVANNPDPKAETKPEEPPVRITRAPEPAGPPRFELKFADGSAVRLQLLQDELQLRTKYGLLTVPVGDLKRIEFAPRFPPDVAAKVAEAVKRFSSDSFDQRETAVRDLIALGEAAFPACTVAARSNDPEVAQRAKAVLRALQEKLPTDQQFTSSADRMVTTEFTAVGEVVNQTLRTRTGYFGEQTIRVADLRTARRMGLSVEATVTVDAAKHLIPADTAWLDTGLEIDAEYKLTITATGQVDISAGGDGDVMSGPDGAEQFDNGDGNGYTPGALLGRIGREGPVFVVGSNYKASPVNQAGTLYLRISPSPWRRPGKGSYTVKVAATP